MLSTDDPIRDPAEGLSIRIYSGLVEDKEKTKENGYPTSKEVPFIQIRIPGDSTFVRVGPMTEEEKRLYPRHWERYQRNQSTEGIVGSVLDEWTPMPRSMVDSYRHFGIRTVEQLAAMSDINARAVPQGVQWRDKAKLWLENAKAAAPMAHVEARIRDMEREIASLRHERDEAMKALDKATDPKVKRG
jgi:hypothetical protein